MYAQRQLEQLRKKQLQNKMLYMYQVSYASSTTRCRLSHRGRTTTDHWLKQAINGRSAVHKSHEPTPPPTLVYMSLVTLVVTFTDQMLEKF